MDYKILILKNRLNKNPNLKKGLDWFTNKLPFNVSVVDIIDTDFDTKYELVSNETVKGRAVALKLDRALLKTLVKPDVYNCVVIIDGNKSTYIDKDMTPKTGLRVGKTYSKPLYNDTYIIQLAKWGDGGKQLNHELFHAMISKANSLGAKIKDPMDVVEVNGKKRFYYNNSSLNAKVSNRTIALGLMAPHMHLIQPITKNISADVVITRRKSTKKQTNGVLVAKKNNMTFSCFTLELPWLDNKRMVSCIPPGLYTCKYSYSPAFKKNTYRLQKVTGRDGILIHSANFFSQLKGCIALGSTLVDMNKDGELDTAQSRIAIDTFEKFMGYQDFLLLIK